MELVNKLLVVAVSSLVLLSCFSMEAAATPLNHKRFRDLLQNGEGEGLQGVTECYKRLGMGGGITEKEASCLNVCKDTFNATSRNFRIAREDYENESSYQNVRDMMNDCYKEMIKCKTCFSSIKNDKAFQEVVSPNANEIVTTLHEVKAMLKEANLGQERTDEELEAAEKKYKEAFDN